MATNVYVWAGATGANDGTSQTDAYTAFQDALTNIVVATETNIYVRGDWTLTTALTITNKYTSWHIPIRIIHVDDTWTEDVTDRGTIDANSVSAYCVSCSTYAEVFEWRNWVFTGATTALFSGINTALGWTMRNCRFQSSPRMFATTSNSHTYKNCTFLNLTTAVADGNNTYLSIMYSKAINCGNGFTATGSFFVYKSIFHASTYGLYSPSALGDLINSLFDGLTYGLYMSNTNIRIVGNRFTHNTNGIYCTSSNSYGTLRAYNSFYNNTNDVGGSGATQIANVRDGGDNLALTGDGYTDRASDDFTLSIGGEGVGVETCIGDKTEAVNLDHFTSGLAPAFPSGTAPIFGGITGVTALSDKSFQITWSAGSGTITSYKVYSKSSTNPFTELPIEFDDTLTSAIVSTLGDGVTDFTVGQTYYFGVVADNDGTGDGNTTELSAVCDGVPIYTPSGNPFETEIRDGLKTLMAFYMSTANGYYYDLGDVDEYENANVSTWPRMLVRILSEQNIDEDNTPTTHYRNKLIINCRYEHENTSAVASVDRELTASKLAHDLKKFFGDYYRLSAYGCYEVRPSEYKMLHSHDEGHPTAVDMSVEAFYIQNRTNPQTG